MASTSTASYLSPPLKPSYSTPDESISFEDSSVSPLSDKIDRKYEESIEEIDTSKTTFIVIIGVQLIVMLKRNWLLMRRRIVSTLAQAVIAPITFMLLLWILQKAYAQLQSRAIYYPTPYPLNGVLSCQGAKLDSPCISLFFTPDTPDVRTILTSFTKRNSQRTGQAYWNFSDTIDMSTVPTTQLGMIPVPNADFIYNYTLRYPNTTMLGIEFTINNTVPTVTYQYQTWFNMTLAANNSDIFGDQLLAFQVGIDEALISFINQDAPVNFNVTLKDWPKVPPSYIADLIVESAGAMFFFCSEMIIFINVLNAIVSEKEQHLKHSLLMFGLKSEVYWISWFLSNLLLVIACAIVTCIFGVAFNFQTFKNADFIILLLTFAFFGQAMVSFAFFITTFCSKTNQAVLSGIFIFVIGLLFQSVVFSSGFLGYIWWDPYSIPSVGWIILQFLPFFNFGKIFLDMSQLTTGYADQLTSTFIPGPGFHWADLYNPLPTKYLPQYDASGRTPLVPAPIQSWYFLLGNIAFYSLLTWYLDKVIPDEFGTRKSPFFFLLPRTYGFRSKKFSETKECIEWVRGRTRGAKFLEDEDESISKERISAFDPDEDFALRVMNLRKVYKSSWFRVSKNDKVAVNDVCLTLREGKLLALLGQNGAGKSTTMNILTGLTPANGGDAILYGNTVSNDMHTIRSIMGVCPQHDILFNDLSAEEHIKLYAGIKNVPKHLIRDLIEDRLKAVRLWKVRDRWAGTYSGGMKRRLSMVISTIGDPKIIVMDEPTTGMDPVNRRHVWSFVEKFKKGRIIILTTHSMEEAEVLGDRIAVMAHGRLRALGNSITLKNKFGAGYRISLVTYPADSARVKDLVASFIPEATLEDDSAGALIYQFPLGSMDRIPEFVLWLESKKDGAELINAWGISQTTLEEVFLKLIREANPKGYQGYEMPSEMKGVSNMSIRPISAFTSLSGPITEGSEVESRPSSGVAMSSTAVDGSVDGSLRKRKTLLSFLSNSTGKRIDENDDDDDDDDKKKRSQYPYF